MSDYKSILKKGWGEIPKVQLLPDGTWRLRCRGATVVAPRDESGSPKLLVTYEAQEPMSDVDEAALAAMDGYDYANTRLFADLWLSDSTDFDKVRTHLEKHGVDPSTFDTIDASLKAMKGTEVLGYIKTENYTDRTGAPQTKNAIVAFNPVA